MLNASTGGNLIQGEVGELSSNSFFGVTGKVAVFYGYIQSLIVPSDDWYILASFPTEYKNLSDINFIFSPLIGKTGDTNLYRRDGDINGYDIRAYLTTSDTGKRINFSGVAILR